MESSPANGGGAIERLRGWPAGYVPFDLCYLQEGLGEPDYVDRRAGTETYLTTAREIAEHSNPMMLGTTDRVYRLLRELEAHRLARRRPLQPRGRFQLTIDTREVARRQRASERWWEQRWSSLDQESCR